MVVRLGWSRLAFSPSSYDAEFAFGQKRRMAAEPHVRRGGSGALVRLLQGLRDGLVRDEARHRRSGPRGDPRPLHGRYAEDSFPGCGIALRIQALHACGMHGF